MTEIAIVFAEKWHISPFDVLEKDVDDFILIANNLVENTTKHEHKQVKKAAKKDDGFWDM